MRRSRGRTDHRRFRSKDGAVVWLAWLFVQMLAVAASAACSMAHAKAATTAGWLLRLTMNWKFDFSPLTSDMLAVGARCVVVLSLVLPLATIFDFRWCGPRLGINFPPCRLVALNFGPAEQTPTRCIPAETLKTIDPQSSGATTPAYPRPFSPFPFVMEFDLALNFFIFSASMSLEWVKDWVLQSVNLPITCIQHRFFAIVKMTGPH
jgi:hypothetical protein